MKRVTIPEIKITVGDTGEQGGLGVVLRHVNEVAFQDTSRDVDMIAGYMNQSLGKRSSPVACWCLEIGKTRNN